MSEQIDRDYHARRAAEERRLAESSTDPRIAALHLDVAVRYEEPAEPMRRS